MIRVYIALGSNLAEPLAQISNALQALRCLHDTHLVTCSSFYRTRPLGSQDQDDYLNAVAALDTLLSPEQLLDQLQAIEHQQGRVRNKHQRFAPRTLDLDIMLYGNEVICTERLTIPHYGLKEREFMLWPLAEIAPHFIFPDRELLTERLKQVSKNGMSLWTTDAGN